MRAILLTVALFAAWWAIGLALLAAVRADVGSLRVALTAPAVGLCVTLLSAFGLNRAGLAIDDVGVPLVLALMVAAAVVLVRRRPRPPAGVLPVIGVCGAALVLTGWPMFDLGLTWLGNANDDMANYALVASRLLHHGFWAPLDGVGLAQGRDYATTMIMYYATGVRPGAETLTALIQAVTGRAGYEVWMPLVLALHLTGVCAVGALAMQLARRWWAATLAAGLLAIAPLASYGVVQQLAHQTGGLALGAALLALLMRPELHATPGPRLRDALLIGTLVAGLVALSSELIPTLGVAYLCYLAVLAFRRELRLPAAALRLWAPALAVAAIALIGYVPEAVRFLNSVTHRGLNITSGHAPLFGFMLVPAGLTGVPGLQTLPTSAGSTSLDLSIVVAVGVLLAALAASVLSARRGGAAAIVVVVQAGLAATLYARSSDFGLFKLAMYAQPFLAAAVAAWIAGLRRPVARLVAAAPLLPLTVAALSTQHAYVERSKNPVDFRHASSGQMATFRHAVDTAGPHPIVSATDNVFLIKLEAVAARGHPVHFLSRDALSKFLREPGPLVDAGLRRSAKRVLRLLPSRGERFDLQAGASYGPSKFAEEEAGSAALRTGACTLVLPSGSQVVFNRRHLPEGSPDLLARRCGTARNTLVFTYSSLGQHYYLPEDRPRVSYFQLEPDYFFAGRTFSGFGRYALFRVLDPSLRVRLAFAVTETVRHDGGNRLPPAAVVGAGRQRLPLVGRGSARVFSPPLRPQMIDGQPYLMLDMGVPGRLARAKRTGLQAIYGKNIPLDPRYLTAYVRDVSLIGDREFAARRPPAGLQHFPADLANPDLEYSGIYEDGWIGEHAYAVVAGGPTGQLVLEGSRTATPGGRLEVRVDGRRVVDRTVRPEPFSIRARVPASRLPRKIELRLSGVAPLPAPDGRPVSALLSYLGVVPGR